MALRIYRDLEVWQKSVDLVVMVYRVTKKMPAAERFGIVSQIQRATVSIPANIAEGHARKHRGDYVHHLSIASGSLAELETHLTVAVRLEYIEREAAKEIGDLCQEIGKMLRQLMKVLEPNGKPAHGTPNPKP